MATKEELKDRLRSLGGDPADHLSKEDLQAMLEEVSPEAGVIRVVLVDGQHARYLDVDYGPGDELELPHDAAMSFMLAGNARRAA
jgi:hypothetical protein